MFRMDSRHFGKGYTDGLTHGLVNNTVITHGGLKIVPQTVFPALLSSHLSSRETSRTGTRKSRPNWLFEERCFIYRSSINELHTRLKTVWISNVFHQLDSTIFHKHCSQYHSIACILSSISPYSKAGFPKLCCTRVPSMWCVRLKV